MPRTSSLEINKTIEGSECTFILKGQLDSITAPNLQSKVLECIDSLTLLRFDMTDVEMLTSAGLRVLLLARQKTEDNDAEMILTGVSDDMKQMFGTVGFLSILTIV